MPKIQITTQVIEVGKIYLKNIILIQFFSIFFYIKLTNISMMEFPPPCTRNTLKRTLYKNCMKNCSSAPSTSHLKSGTVVGFVGWQQCASPTALQIFYLQSALQVGQQVEWDCTASYVVDFRSTHSLAVSKFIES